jgi:hypothetical protein
MGERNWYTRYRVARDYADEQAAGYARGELIEGWRQVSETDPCWETLIGRAWIAWAYEVATSNAEALAQTQGEHWRPLVNECTRLTQVYHAKASAAHG